MFLAATAISTLGIALDSRIKSMQEFQVLTNFLLMLMFFLSGVIFPLNASLEWMNIASKINRLSYGIDAMHYVMLGDSSMQLYPLWLDIVVLVGLIIVDEYGRCDLIQQARIAGFYLNVTANTTLGHINISSNMSPREINHLLNSFSIPEYFLYVPAGKLYILYKP